MSTAGVTVAPAPLPLMRSAFRTTVSYGPDRKYEMVFAFRSLEDMQNANREWHDWIAAGVSPSDDQTFPNQTP